jgi:hypothetical protein
MLSSDSVGLWSWGEELVTVTSRNGMMKDKFELPRIVTRKSKKDIYLHYLDRFFEDKDWLLSKPLGRSVFMEILNHVVSGDSRMLTAVDYVTGLLLHDTCNILLRIIKEFLLGYQEEKVDRFIQLLEVAQNFLKVQFISHARKKDGCCTHGTDFGLSKPQNFVEQYEPDGKSNSDSEFKDNSSQDDGVNQDEANNNHPEFTCSACKFPFYFLHKLSDEIELGHQHRPERIGSVDSHNDKLEDVRSVIWNAHEKLYLFMAHKTRVQAKWNQADGGY